MTSQVGHWLRIRPSSVTAIPRRATFPRGGRFCTARQLVADSPGIGAHPGRICAGAS